MSGYNGSRDGYDGGHKGIRSRIREQEPGQRKAPEGRRPQSGQRPRRTDPSDQRMRQRGNGQAGGKRKGNNYRFIHAGLILIIILAAAAIIYVQFIKKGRVGGVSDTDTEQTAESGELTGLTTEEQIAADPDLTEDQKRLFGLKASLESGNSVMDTLRKYFPEDIVLYKDQRYVFTPIDDKLKKHEYSLENLKVLENGEWQYVDTAGQVISHKGIDVSSHQGEIDWAKVGATDVEFAIIRAMYRGYSTGKLVEDEQFKANIAGADANGIKAGIYIFTQAISEAEVDEEIEMLKGLIGDNEVAYPVVVDVEEADGGNGRMDALSVEERTHIIKYYCDQIKAAGYTPMIYFNIEGAILMLDLEELEGYDKWFAGYNEDFYYPYQYSIRQYSNTGRIDGIEGDVDLNISFLE